MRERDQETDSWSLGWILHESATSHVIPESLRPSSCNVVPLASGRTETQRVSAGDHGLKLLLRLAALQLASPGISRAEKPEICLPPAQPLRLSVYRFFLKLPICVYFNPTSPFFITAIVKMYT